MKEMIWIGDEAMIPGVGLGQPNQPIMLPDDLAGEFKERGRVKDMPTQNVKSIKPIEQENE